MAEWVMEGVPEFEAALGRLSVAVELAGRTATATAAHLVEAEAKKQLSIYAHAKGTPTPSPPGGPPATVTGTLRRSIHVDGPRRKGFGVYEARVGPSTVYARVQELGGGRSNLPPRPYLSPALAAVRPALAAIYRRAWAGALVR